MPGDLHTHTTWSDGSTPAARLPFLARAAGLTALAVSDHDSVESVRHAYAHPEIDGIALIPATELTAYDYARGRRVHILCYWPDDCAALADHCARMAARRRAVALQTAQELEKLFPQFTAQQALDEAAESNTVYKAHLMRVLWQYGLADGLYGETYHKLFVPGGVLHDPQYETVDTVLDLVKACRGVAVLAHPSVYKTMPLARELIAAGRLDGVEIDHPRNTPEDEAELRELAQKYDLIVTGGSDYHGLNTKVPRPVGAGATADEMIDRINTLARARKA